MKKYKYRTADEVYNALKHLPDDQKDQFFRKCVNDFFDPKDDIIIREISAGCDFDCHSCSREDRMNCQRELREGVAMIFAILENHERTTNRLDRVESLVSVVERTCKEEEAPQESKDDQIYG